MKEKEPYNRRSRKWHLTINNPVENGLTHEQIKKNLAEFTGVDYWCMCDEKGETYHTHLFIHAKNPIAFSTIKHKFKAAHIDKANGTCEENRNYIRKEGKYADSDKKETNISETFEEWGEMPDERSPKVTQSEAIVDMIKDGCSTLDIIEAYPSSYTKQAHMEKLRQETLKSKHSGWREVEVTYIWGKTNVGKTRYVMEKYNYDVCKITNYKNPFDHYDGHDVILFDEFNGQILISDMLQYLDGYPCLLPARYADKVACFTKVYIVSNFPFASQYKNIQSEKPEQWEAFKRRFSHIYEMIDGGVLVEEKPESDVVLPDDFEEILGEEVGDIFA
ncbi:MAG: viral replication protein [Oscillospiraceae bacterium]|nr:viral replication protein [Oscillospiraceae bacterium]